MKLSYLFLNKYLEKLIKGILHDLLNSQNVLS